MYFANKKLYLPLVGVIIGLISVLFPQFIVISVVIIVTIILAFYFITFNEKDKAVLIFRIFLIALTLRLVICLLLSLISYFKRGHPFFWGADDYGFSISAIDAARRWKNFGIAWKGNEGYVYFLTYLYYLVGEYKFLPLFINCCFGALTVIFIYFISKKIYNSKVASSAALLFTFWPSGVLWATQNLKEPIAVFIVYFVFWRVLEFRKWRVGKNRDIYFLIILFLLFILTRIRSGTTICLILSIAIAKLFFSTKKRLIFSLLGIIILIIAFRQNWFYINDFFLYKFGLSPIKIHFFELLNQYRYYRTQEGSTVFLPNLKITSLQSFILNSPIILMYIFFAPFPWQVFKASQLFAAMEMLIWYILVIFAIKGFLISIHYKLKEASMIIIFLVIIIFIFFIDANVGSLFRHRYFIWPILHIMISAGLFYRVEKQKLIS